MAKKSASGKMSEGVYCVYLLRCCDGSLYCGISSDLERRLKLHNQGKGARYTATHRPVVLEFSTGQWFPRAEAQAIELRVKKMRRDDKRPYLERLEANRETKGRVAMQEEETLSLAIPGFNPAVP
jgi:putative endonuclease